MNGIITLKINEGIAASKEVTVISDNAANVFITASSYGEALQMLSGSDCEMLKACKDWEPETDPEAEPVKHYKVATVANEDTEDFITSFLESKHGAKFAECVNRSELFRYRHEGTSIFTIDFYYFMSLVYQDAFDGLYKMYNWAFRKGYKKAKMDLKSSRI